MPVAAFIDDAHLPALGLTNAWGYNPVSYFAIDPRLAPRGPQELRFLTDLYRKNGISIILDVVYNHTGEGDNMGPVLSLKGLDALAYYRHVEVDGKQVLVNDAGTGNTLRCDHPATQRLVIESLRYWVQETGVSGFRFDLATVLGREPAFNPDAKMLQMIKADAVLSRCQLVAEPWDPGPGGYGVGKFGKEFREWNDTYRDEVRGFWRGEPGHIGALAGKVAGSAEIYNFAGRKPSAGVNFIAVHDGFTLADLVSYVDKHNEANGEGNRDGNNNNSSSKPSCIVCQVMPSTSLPQILNQGARLRPPQPVARTFYSSLRPLGCGTLTNQRRPGRFRALHLTRPQHRPETS